MDQELSKYYETYFGLFLHNGWKQLIKDLTEARDGYIKAVIDNKLSNEDYHYWRGEIARINAILNLQETLERAYEELKEDAVVSDQM